jgi:ribosomal protein S18 acetylase RimI-like enzyme
MLMVRADNEPVLAFYDNLGYQRETVRLTGRRLIPDDRPGPAGEDPAPAK